MSLISVLRIFVMVGYSLWCEKLAGPLYCQIHRYFEKIILLFIWKNSKIWLISIYGII